MRVVRVVRLNSFACNILVEKTIKQSAVPFNRNFSSLRVVRVQASQAKFNRYSSRYSSRITRMSVVRVVRLNSFACNILELLKILARLNQQLNQSHYA